MWTRAFFAGLLALFVAACQPSGVDRPAPGGTVDPADDPVARGDETELVDAPVVLDPTAAPETPTEPPVTEPPVTEPPVTEPPVIGPTCFADIFDENAAGPDYDQFQPTVGSHCLGTDHQDITGVERVVFVGDSVTVGTPPTAKTNYYRSRLADALADRFGLTAPGPLWQSSNPLTGQAGVRQSGDFWACAEWGARTDDLLEDNSQLPDCFPAEERSKKTLVIMTIGGNDVASFTKSGATAPYEETRAKVVEYVDTLRSAVQWLKDPTEFPADNNLLVFANMFEFTDGTGDVDACAAASVAGFDEPWQHPEWLEEFVIWANEQYMSIAVDTGTDMVFLLESFCGHGFRNDDPSNRCYRGPDAERWFDATCIHPNPTGHEKIAEMFLAVVDE